MSSGPDFGRGDHVRIVPSGTAGQVTHVYRAPGRAEALEYDVVGNDGSRHVVRPGNLEPAPMYVIVERCLGSGSRSPNVYDCHPDSDLENVQERAAGRQANAIRCGRPEDTYRVAELRYLDAPTGREPPAGSADGGHDDPASARMRDLALQRLHAGLGLPCERCAGPCQIDGATAPTPPAVCVDEWQPPHDAGSHPEDCRTCSEGGLGTAPNPTEADRG